MLTGRQVVSAAANQDEKIKLTEIEREFLEAFSFIIKSGYFLE